MSTLPDLDLVTSAVLRLSVYLPFQQLVRDGFIGTDAAASADDAAMLSQAWLFQGLDNEGRPFRDPEGSGASVIVLSERREWTSPNLHNTAYFPQLQMLIYTDCSRDPATGAERARDADRRCKHIFRILDRCFHLPSNQPEDHAWPGMTVHSSLRGAPFSVSDVPNTESSVVRGETVYQMITN